MDDKFFNRLARGASRAEPLKIGKLPPAALPWLIQYYGQHQPALTVIVVESFSRAESLRQDLEYFSVQAAFFPHWETPPFSDFSPSKDTIAKRLDALYKLCDGSAKVLVTTAQALLGYTMPRNLFKQCVLNYNLSAPPQYSQLAEALLFNGYVRTEMVELPGEFSVHGDIIDVFPAHYINPVRLDFLDEDLEEMRIFDAESQTTIKACSSISIVPATEAVLNATTRERALQELPRYKKQIAPEIYWQLAENLEGGVHFSGLERLMGLLYPQTGHILDYVKADATIVIEEMTRFEELIEAHHQDVLEEYQVCLEEGTPCPALEQTYTEPEQLQQRIKRFSRIETSQFTEPDALESPLVSNEFLATQFMANDQPAVKVLEEWQQAGAQIIICADSQTRLAQMQSNLLRQDLNAVPSTIANIPLTPEAIKPGLLQLIEPAPQAGFQLKGTADIPRLALITEYELKGAPPRQQQRQSRRNQQSLGSLSRLSLGDAVVHVDYGVGRYEGLKTIAAQSTTADYLVIRYAGSDVVYVPVHNMHLVHRYSSGDSNPPLHKLGDAAWKNSRNKTYKAIRDMTEELIRLQAERKVVDGIAFKFDQLALEAFADTFIFQETPDQQAAIEDVYNDMQNLEPMDRLISGDAGFGKTEVALRAAYLAVINGYQVMLMSPTTVLASQHFNTFNKRMEPFAVKTKLFSRFVAAPEQKQVLADFAESKVDILIGTHKLLSKQVKPKNLGLLIIDEEHRFGVTHKEKLKQLKARVDVLTMSATPIPRTLHMSLSGLLKVSTIQTAPPGRRSVRTRIIRRSEHAVREGIERELRRNGRVFFVHNRVEDIHIQERWLHKVVPQAKIGVAHGQMSATQLERIMLDFVEGRTNVLLCTTIIESGLDIPEANCIFINRAENYGLAQLYQIRGRVGRSSVPAYAWLLTTPGRAQSSVARKRLRTIQELSEQGTGFMVALQDLELRGTGNLLGAEQSGHIHSVGLEMYTELVNQAVTELKEGTATLSNTTGCAISLNFPYILPEKYIPGISLRLEIYKQISQLKHEEQCWELRQSLEDRFGKLPAEAIELFDVIQLKIWAQNMGITSIKQHSDHIKIELAEQHNLNIEHLIGQIAANPQLSPATDNSLILRSQPDSAQSLHQQLGAILQPKAIHTQHRSA